MGYELQAKRISIAPIFRSEQVSNFKLGGRSKNERSRVIHYNTHEKSCIKARPRATFPGAGSPSEISKENEFPFRTGLIFCFFFIKR